MSRTYVPGLTGLRALAIGAVVAEHSGLPFAAGGSLGVNVFFVLSGYLITSILLRQYDHAGRIDFKAFMIRRLRRLTPALLAMLVVVALVAGLAPLRLSAEFHFPAFARTLLAAGTYTMDIDMLHGVPGGPLFHTWSLAVEMQFYLMWPWVLLGALLLGARTRGLLRISIGAMIIVAIWRLWVLHHGSGAHLQYGLDTQADQLLAGAVVAILDRSNRLPTRALTWLSPVALVVLGVLVIHALSLAELTDGGYVLLYVCSGVLVAHLASGRPMVLLRPLEHPWVVYVGEISYGIYLWHFPVFHALTASALGIPRLGSICVRLTVTFGLAALSYHTIERWFRKPAARRVDQPVLTPRSEVAVAATEIRTST